MVRGLKSIVILIIISAVFNLFLTPGDVLIQIWKLTITYQGLKMAIFMVVRLIYLIVGTSLMTLTTTPNNLTDGLEKGLGFLKSYQGTSSRDSDDDVDSIKIHTNTYRRN